MYKTREEFDKKIILFRFKFHSDIQTQSSYIYILDAYIQLSN